ncbi:prohead protease/major capsid protein fusion protein [Methylobacterium aquaticum]|nr:prohead protease/major capsid protein fusion protein [Methylobacterium aquaticum]
MQRSPRAVATLSVGAVLSLGVLAALVAALSPDLGVLAAHKAAGLAGLFHGHGLTVAGPFALAALRAHEADLGTRVAAKFAELTDGLAAEARAAIEGEHAALVTELDGVRAEIRGLEAAPPQPAQTPGPAPAETSRAERERSAALLDIGTRAGMTTAQIGEALAGSITVDAFRTRAFDALAARSEETMTRPTQRAQIVGEADEEKRGAAIENALLHRHAPGTVQLTEHGRQYRGMTILEMGSDLLEARGIKTRGLSKQERAGLMLETRSDAARYAVRSGGMLTTSDFANVLANVANKTLRMGYDAAPQTFRPLVRVVTVPDFKPVSRVQLGEAPKLEKVNEKGEFTRGNMGDAAERYAISTYGKIVSITRQVLVNDDLDAFTRVPRAFGVAAANLESDLVWGQITANPVMGDGNALFSAAHGNLLASGSAIATASVGAMRQAMRVQTGLDGKTLLNITPTYIVVPTALETVTEQFLGQIFPTKSADVVTSTMKKLVPISEPRLDVASATNWYIAADPAMIDLIELAYLEGQEGLYTETKMGFDVDGIEVKVRQDVGAKVIDWRGLQKNPA